MKGIMRFIPVVPLLLFIAGIFTANGQSDPSSPPSGELVKAIDKIIYSPEFIIENQIGSAIRTAHAAYRLSEKTGNDTLKIKSLLVLGRAKIFLADYDTALTVLSDGAARLIRINDQLLEANYYAETAKLLKFMRDYENSLVNYIKAASTFTILQLPDNLAITNLGIAELFRKLGLYEKASNALNEVKAYIENNHPSDFVLAEYYNRMAAIYNENPHSGSEDSSLYFTNHALQVSEKCGNRHLIAVSLNELGFIYEGKHRVEEAMESYTQAEHTWDELRFFRYSITVKINIARLLNKSGKYTASIRKLKEVLLLSATNGWDDMFPYANQELAVSYELQGETAKALQFYKKYFEQQLTAFDIEKNKDIAGIDAKYQLEKKEKRNLLLQQDNKNSNRMIRYLSVALLVVSVLFFIVFVRNNKLKKTASIANRKLQELSSASP